MRRNQLIIDVISDLSVLLHSGMALDDALKLSAQTNTNDSMRSVLSDVRDGVRAGHSLSEEMAKYSMWFDNFVCGIVMAGEASGNLPEALDRLVDQLERDLALRSKIINALIYPMILWVVMSISLIIVLAVILPQLATVIESLNAPRSLLTSGLVFFGNFISDWGQWLIIVALALILISWLFRHELNIRMRASKLVRKIMPLNTLLAKMEFARFAGTLSSLLASGLPQVEALRITSRSLQSSENRQALMRVIEHVQMGQTLGSSIEEFTDVGGLYTHSIRAGEEGGRLAPTLDRLSRRLENEFSQSTQRLAATVEPVLIVLMGVIIGLVVYAVFTALQTVGEISL